jgi:hypothetical protein
MGLIACLGVLNKDLTGGLSRRRDHLMMLTRSLLVDDHSLIRRVDIGDRGSVDHLNNLSGL